MPRPKPAVVNLQTGLFTQHLIALVAFVEGTGTPGLTIGPDGGSITTPLVTVSGTPTWTTNSEGAALACGTADYLVIGGNATWLPTTACTICVVRRKRDTTNRNSVLVGVDALGSGTGKLAFYCPYGSGAVTWDYGGNAGANSLTASPNPTFSTSVPDLLIVTAGTSGSTIWQNGTKIATQATGLSRTITTDLLRLNSGAGQQGDSIDYNYFAIYDTQWDDTTAAAWSANPYGFLSAAFPRSGFGAKKHRPGRTKR